MDAMFCCIILYQHAYNQVNSYNVGPCCVNQPGVGEYISYPFKSGEACNAASFTNMGKIEIGISNRQQRNNNAYEKCYRLLSRVG
jgi:hypothetical protein